jgi:hypothetical protein
MGQCWAVHLVEMWDVLKVRMMADCLVHQMENQKDVLRVPRKVDKKEAERKTRLQIEIKLK